MSNDNPDPRIALGRELATKLFAGGPPTPAIHKGLARNTVAHYAGWPVAVSASRTLAEVWETMDSEEEARKNTK
jgi:hypothetical protein